MTRGPRTHDRRTDDDREDTPPVLGSWRLLYGLVLGALAALIAFMALFMARYT